jgi:membrane-associated protease RseP (regulator of RpoE activity)
MNQRFEPNKHDYPIEDRVTDIYTPLVQRVFRIEDTTWGNTKQGYIVRYRGRLLIDSELAFEQLSDAFRTHNITPLFRMVEDRQTILLTPGVIQPKPSKTWVNILLFSMTLLSMLYVGTIYTLGGVYQGPPSPNVQQLAPYIKDSLGGGLAFTLSFLAILLAHEFGHFFVARYHRTEVSLPYFLPFPNLLGTLGAVILTKEIPRNKKVLLDIGIAGPLAGLVVTIPVLILGIATSNVHQLPNPLQEGISFEGNSILYLFLKFLIHGKFLPEPTSYGGISPFIYWVRYFFTGLPFPTGGIDMTMNPVALAGWAGLLVTGLNLIPIGQLDGGHLIYGILGRQTKKIAPFIISALLILGFFWNGWWLWAVLLLIFNRKHGEPLDDITPLDSRRKTLAVIGLIAFILVFMPVPMASPFGF